MVDEYLNEIFMAFAVFIFFDYTFYDYVQVLDLIKLVRWEMFTEKYNFGKLLKEILVIGRIINNK